ncbi:MAG: hypothetical protein ACW99G_02760 [Candidatus Thorarchaeota archaeon]|jgi:hypothetical protein
MEYVVFHTPANVNPYTVRICKVKGKKLEKGDLFAMGPSLEAVRGLMHSKQPGLALSVNKIKSSEIVEFWS